MRNRITKIIDIPILTNPDTITAMVISGRARQALRLLGYRISVSHEGADAGAADEVILGGALHTVNPEAAGTLWSPGNSEFQASRIDEIMLRVKTSVLGGSGGFVFPESVNSGWVYTDLLLPAVYASGYHFNEKNLQALGQLDVVLEYEWQTVSIDEIAAINFAWGRDPQDFDDT